MRTESRALRPLIVGVVACLFLLGSGAFAQTRPLKILLTNDDGYDAPGLRIMRETLAAAGHQVTVIAPLTNMSSTSGSMTSGVVKFEKKGDAIWAVHGTPADSALIGIVHLLRDVPQDLVVSGTNAGQNIGTSTNGSGTVGAAVAAALLGVPAIATSAGSGASSTSGYDVAADLARQIITALDATRPSGAKLLPDRLVVNVNVPALPADRLLGLRFAPLSRRGGFTRQYRDTGTPGEVQSQLAVTAPLANETDTDLTLFTRGYATITILDGDMSIDAASAGAAVAARLSKLALPRPAAQAR